MSFDISNVVNRGSVRWVVLAVFLFGTIFGAAGIAAAQLDGSETLFYDNTTDITDDTTELKVTINGTNNYETYVNFYRIADDSTETLETEDVNLSSAEGVTTNTTYAVETNNTAAYRVVVHNNGENPATASEIGNVTVTTVNSGTGGSSGGYSPGNAPIIGIIAVAALLVVIRKA